MCMCVLIPIVQIWQGLHLRMLLRYGRCAQRPLHMWMQQSFGYVRSNSSVLDLRHRFVADILEFSTALNCSLVVVVSQGLVQGRDISSAIMETSHSLAPSEVSVRFRPSNRGRVGTDASESAFAMMTSVTLHLHPVFLGCGLEFSRSVHRRSSSLSSQSSPSDLTVPRLWAMPSFLAAWIQGRCDDASSFLVRCSTSDIAPR
ncbi:hypothetical protein C8Q80DRAFT_327980 [Daedaleopsis nitida]|nr:hypothetical protein C8Q80DRAFT_327980 [Daedaleopsis nitida]